MIYYSIIGILYELYTRNTSMQDHNINILYYYFEFSHYKYKFMIGLNSDP